MTGRLRSLVVAAAFMVVVCSGLAFPVVAGAAPLARDAGVEAMAAPVGDPLICVYNPIRNEEICIG